MVNLLAKNNKNQNVISYANPPASLDDSMFFGLTLDENQKKFRDAIWDESKTIVMCDSKAGTGKSLISVAVAHLLVKYGFYDGIIYIMSPTQEQVQGFLPGTIEEKSAPYMQPLIDSLITIGEDPDTRAACANSSVRSRRSRGSGSGSTPTSS